MDAPCYHARKQGSPSLCTASASSGLSALNFKWAEDVHPDEGEWRSFRDSLFWEIGHDLVLTLTSEPLACHTIFDHLGNLPLATQNPV